MQGWVSISKGMIDFAIFDFEWFWNLNLHYVWTFSLFIFLFFFQSFTASFFAVLKNLVRYLGERNMWQKADIVLIRKRKAASRRICAIVLKLDEKLLTIFASFSPPSFLLCCRARRQRCFDFKFSKFFCTFALILASRCICYNISDSDEMTDGVCWVRL